MLPPRSPDHCVSSTAPSRWQRLGPGWWAGEKTMDAREAGERLTGLTECGERGKENQGQLLSFWVW